MSLTIDGTGLPQRFVIPANSQVDLETIPDTGRALTFFANDTDEARQALLNHVSKKDLGVISCTLTLEMKRPVAVLSFFGGGNSVMRGGINTFGAGGTGLSGKSTQQFQKTTFRDDPQILPVTINLRLVHDTERNRSPSVQPIPGKTIANEVPPPI